MNERIKRLAEQAEKYADDNFRGEPTWSEAFETKFAELIVQECIEIVDSGYLIGPGNQIRKHFGVEEQVNDSKELHTCPYREELHNDYESLCDCDEEQQHQCAMDI